jgi:hypothetical protein
MIGVFLRSTNVDDRCGVHKLYGNMTLLYFYPRGLLYSRRFHSFKTFSRGLWLLERNFNNSVKAYRPLLCVPTLAFPLPWQSTSYLSQDCKVHNTSVL